MRILFAADVHIDQDLLAQLAQQVLERHADVPTEERCSEGPSPIKIHLMGREDLPLLGVFATRCFDRPNPICATTVRLLERTGSVLLVDGLDAFNGSPILDIKPYVPYLDSATEVKMPEWMSRLAQLLGVGDEPL